ncbi:MAG: response regulator, partial [Saprospiraceae bacterium]|nr:response regulator [Saprospiraceae bacterium]
MKTILAIDDQKDNLTTIAAVIKTNLPNCEVLTALSGKEGIEIARKEQPDTILLDIIMPVMDGFEVCTKLKEDELTKHIPVIMLTAIKTDAKSRVKGLDIGADAFLAKPIDSVELSAQVNVMLRIKEAEDKLREEKLNLEELVEKKTKGLIESEFKFRNIIQQSDDGISITDEEGKLIEWNKSLEKITGIKEKDVLGKYIWDVHSQFHGETKQSQKEL